MMKAFPVLLASGLGEVLRGFIFTYFLPNSLLFLLFQTCEFYTKERRGFNSFIGLLDHMEPIPTQSMGSRSSTVSEDAPTASRLFSPET